MNGWVKLHRKFAAWEWGDEPKMVSLFIHLLLAASNRGTQWKGQSIERGQVIFGLEKWSKETGISIQSLRTCLKKLKSTGEIVTKSTSKYTIVTICNYDQYQEEKPNRQQANQQADQQATNKQLTSNQQHREKVKKEKKEEEEKNEPTKPFNVTDAVADSVVDGLF